VLGVVQHDEQSPVPELLLRVIKQLPTRHLIHAQGLRDGGKHELWVAQRRQSHPPESVGKPLRNLSRCLESEPCLPSPARTSQRHQSHVVPAYQPDDLGELLRPPQKGGRGHGQIRPVQAPKRRELFDTELKHPLGRSQIPEPMLAQVAQRRLDERSRRRAHEHLTTVPGSRYPRGAVHISAHISLVGYERRSGVYAHPEANRPATQSLRDQPGGLQRVRCAGEGQKECVALGIDLGAAERCTCLAHHPPMFAQHPGIRIRTEFVE
jgi:hypothetical protein